MRIHGLERASWAVPRTGAFLLAEAGVLTTQQVTTHWEDVDDLRTGYPGLTVHESKRWVDEGRIVTSGGISAGIDMCLHLVGRLYGPDAARKTARQMEFNWISEPDAAEQVVNDASTHPCGYPRRRS